MMINRGILRSFIVLGVSTLAGVSIFAGNILPSGYTLPSEPNPQGTGCVSCSSSESPEAVSLNASGFAKMEINLNTLSSINHKLLSIELGKTPAFMPATYYQLSMPGTKDGLTGYLLVRIGDEKVGFDLSAISGDATRIFRSKNYEQYSLVREQSNIIVRNYKNGKEFVFSSEDGGANWRLSMIRDRNCPAKTVTCEYSKDGLMSAVINPDGSRYAITYTNGLPSKVVDPAGAITDISYNVRGQISAVQTSLPKTHPLYPKTGLKPNAVGKPFVVRDIHLECDAEGRILTLVNTDGEKYVAEYQKHTADKNKKDTAYTLGTLKKPDGTKLFVRVSLNSDGSRIEVKGRVVIESGTEIFKTENEIILKSKCSTVCAFKKVVNGRTTDFTRDGSTIAVTSETDALGRVTRYTYDGEGRKIATIYPDGSSVKYKYDEADHVIEKADEMDRSTVYKYDDGLLKLVSDKGIVTVYSYDKNGLPVESVEAGDRVHKFEFDKLCRIISHTRPDGVTTQYTYLKNLNQVEKIELIPAKNEDASQKVLPPYVRKFTYEPWSRVASIIYPDNTSEQFKYFCCGLVEAVDRAGGVRKFAYDSTHRKVLEVSPTGTETRFEYDKNGKLAKVINPDKTFVEFAYAPMTGDKIEERKSDSTWVKFEYNDIGERIKGIFSDGTQSVFSYDLRGRIVKISGTNEKNIVREYDRSGKLIAETDHGLPFDPKGRKTSYKLDSVGRVIATINPDGGVTQHFYSEKSGNLIATVAKGIVIRNGLDSVGRINAVARYSSEELAKCKTSEERLLLFENNISEKRNYDAFGNPFEVRTRRNEVSQGAGPALLAPADDGGGFRLLSRYSYSPDGQLNSVLKPVSDSGAIKQSYVYSYKGDGVKEVSVYKKFIENQDLAKLDYREEYGIYQVAAMGNVVPPSKKDIGQLIARYNMKGSVRLNSEDALGNRTEYKYNKNGQLVTVLSNGELQSNLKYDNNGRMKEAEDILGRVYKNIYNEEGRVSGRILPDSAKSEIEYDKYGRITERKGAGSYPLSFSYSSFGEIVSYEDGNGAKTKFEYDSAGHIVKRIWPSGSTVTYSYNGNGLLTQKVESDRITGYTYDNLNRLVKIEITQSSTGILPVSSVTLLSYNADGKPVSVSDESGKIEFAYDDLGRVISEKGLVGEIKYSYNSSGLLSEKLCLLDGKEFKTEYFYDELNRIIRVSSPAGEYSYTYDKKGHIVALSFGNVKITSEYDKAGRLISKKLSNTGIPARDPVLLCSYEYDKLDRRVKASVNGVDWIYGYDKYNQLTTASSSDGKSYGYDFDPIGNRLKDKIQLANREFSYNKLNQIASSGFEYDKYGNLIKSPDCEYRYDLHNRLCEVRKANVTVKYSYDSMGQRIKSEEAVNGNTKVTQFLMSGMVEQARAVDSISQFHTLGLDLSWSLTATGGVGAVLSSSELKTENLTPKTFSYLYDGNGNVISTCDSKGEITAKLAYSPFGEKISGSDLPFTFSTKPSDASSLVYYGFRFYNAEMGRWQSRDPIREKGGENIYGMVRNDSINQTDLLGLDGLVESITNHIADSIIGNSCSPVGATGTITLSGQYDTYLFTHETDWIDGGMSNFSYPITIPTSFLDNFLHTGELFPGQPFTVATSLRQGIVDLINLITGQIIGEGGVDLPNITLEITYKYKNLIGSYKNIITITYEDVTCGCSSSGFPVWQGTIKSKTTSSDSPEEIITYANSVKYDIGLVQ